MRYDFGSEWLPYVGVSVPQGSWHGTLLTDKSDAAGTKYRRNRYYDPQSGRFPQEDPIGLGGGFNACGLASGDPVNFSDPFGLCAPDDTNENDCGSAYYARRIARGEGNRFLNEIGGAINTCNEDERCRIGMWDLISMGVGALRGGGIGLSTHDVGEKGTPSVNQMNQQVKRGSAPSGIKRVDVGNVMGEQDNVHFNDGR